MSRVQVTRVVRSVSAFVCGYAVLATANMAFVLFWFTGRDERWSAAVIGGCAAIWIGATGVAAGRIVEAASGRSGRRHATGASLAAAVVVLASMVWDVSLEPDWYKLWYVALVIGFTTAGGAWADRRRERRAATHSTRA